jgi:hypothetical protein
MHYLAIVITLKLLSHLTVLSSAMDNYMTTHFSASDFIWDFQAKLGNMWKRLG